MINEIEYNRPTILLQTNILFKYLILGSIVSSAAFKWQYADMIPNPCLKTILKIIP